MPYERISDICERCGKHGADGRYYFIAPGVPDEFHRYCPSCRLAWERGEL